MSLPPVDASTGLLPVGRHSATLHELYDRFVAEAPASGFRQRTFEAGQLWLSRAAELFGPGSAWINGGFTTWKLSIPHDMDIAYVPSDIGRANAALKNGDAWGLLTLQDVLYGHPEPGGHLQRLQPIGGMIDAFLVDPRSPKKLAVWHNIWSRVKGPDGKIVPGLLKGYAEVPNP